MAVWMHVCTNTRTAVASYAAVAATVTFSLGCKPATLSPFRKSQIAVVQPFSPPSLIHRVGTAPLTQSEEKVKNGGHGGAGSTYNGKAIPFLRPNRRSGGCDAVRSQSRHHPRTAETPSSTSSCRGRCADYLRAVGRGGLPLQRAGVAASVASLSFALSSSPLLASRRSYTNVLYRFPPQNTVPTHSPSGEEVDTDLFMRQLNGLIFVLRQTQLVEQVHEMRSCPYFDCLFAADLLTQHYDMVLPMPKYMREHRSSEISETLRYIRSSGASADFNHMLQDVKGGAASGGDFVSTTHGILMGFGTERTNRLAMLALTGGSTSSRQDQAQSQAFNVRPIELLPDSPPLGDMLAFAGTRTFIVHDTPAAAHAAHQATKQLSAVAWQVLRLEPGCFFLSHIGGVNSVFDVLCDQDFPESMERLGESGLNPFPVEWSEPRKLGISMRSVCLVARFARGTMNAGGYANSHGHRSSQFNYQSKDIAKKSRLFQGGHRKHGDSGAPLDSQLRTAELPEPVRQRPPRYMPPIHRKGAITPHGVNPE